jgi:hypothetical protein
MQRWSLLGVWLAAGGLAEYLLWLLITNLLQGANNILRGGPAYFRSGASLIAFAGFQCGVIVAVGLTTAAWRGSVLMGCRNSVIAAYAFVVLDFLASNTVP